MMNVEPLTPENFAPYGHVIRSGVGATKDIRGGDVTLTKSLGEMEHAPIAATPALDIYDVQPANLTFAATKIEYHPHTAQLFSPMDVSRWLAAVWPEGPNGPMRAFLARPGDAIFYHPNVWHHGVVAWDRPAKFLSFMWRSGRSDDTVFEDLPVPITISCPDLG
jgi:ureidoglycolate lyase